jgi:hypothetical protein
VTIVAPIIVPSEAESEITSPRIHLGALVPAYEPAAVTLARLAASADTLAADLRGFSADLATAIYVFEHAGGGEVAQRYRPGEPWSTNTGRTVAPRLLTRFGRRSAAAAQRRAGATTAPLQVESWRARRDDERNRTRPTGASRRRKAAVVPGSATNVSCPCWTTSRLLPKWVILHAVAQFKRGAWRPWTVAVRESARRCRRLARGRARPTMVGRPSARRPRARRWPEQQRRGLVGRRKIALPHSSHSSASGGRRFRSGHRATPYSSSEVSTIRPG